MIFARIFCGPQPGGIIMKEQVSTSDFLGVFMRFISFVEIFGVLACASIPRGQEIAGNQASYDFDCPRDKIAVAPLGKNRYTAEGCFKREIYSCEDGFFISQADVVCRQLIGGVEAIELSK